jgi:steroid delta-isomerase-like uncharacterized protein
MSNFRSVLEKSLTYFADPAQRDRYFELYSPDVILHGYAGVEPGLASVRKFYAEAIWAAFPDAAVRIEDVMEEGSKLTCRFVMTGTHQGDYLGVPATGKPIELPGITILRFNPEGQCVERWSCANFLAVLVQIGAFPPKS